MSDKKKPSLLLVTYHSSLITHHLSRIRMQARQQVADAEVGEDDEEEGDDSEVGGGPSSPAARDAHVQEAAVGQPRDERARLLRVPAPVAPPGLVRPDRARHQQERQAREG